MNKHSSRRIFLAPIEEAPTATETETSSAKKSSEASGYCVTVAEETPSTENTCS